MTHEIKHLHSISCSPPYPALIDAMLIQKINRHDCHEEFAYEDNGDWKAAAAVDGGK